MKRFAALLLSMLCLSGCGSSRCRDKTGGFFAWDKAYRACKSECHLEGEEKKKCGCSAACPCWKEHN